MVYPEETHEKWMKKALELARQAAEQGEVPVGAIIINESQLISQAHNRRELDQSPLAHAEILAIGKASESLQSWRLPQCTLYVTLEPCAMCAGAIINSRLKQVVFAASDPKAGAMGSVYNIGSDQKLNHTPDIVSGVRAAESSKLLKDFFSELRK